MGSKTQDIKFLAWYAQLQATVRSLDRIERDVEAETGIPLAWYEIVAFLHSAEDGRRRMSELAESLSITRGGATRIVARMEEEGLVRRETPPENRRATFAVLTDKGRETCDRVQPVHEAAVRRYFTDAISDSEAEALHDMGVRVLGAIGDECAWLVKDLQGATGAEGAGR